MLPDMAHQQLFFEIIVGLIVTLCSFLVTRFVNKISNKIEHIATVEYVDLALKKQSEELSQLFVKQAVVETIEGRMEKLEDQIWKRFDNMLGIVTAVRNGTPIDAAAPSPTQKG